MERTVLEAECPGAQASPVWVSGEGLLITSQRGRWHRGGSVCESHRPQGKTQEARDQGGTWLPALAGVTPYPHSVHPLTDPTLPQHHPTGS